MTNLYAEWKKLKNNVESTSARLYRTKNENTEREFEEAVEALVNFEKDNGIPPMADEARVKKMFCPQTNEEWFSNLDTEDKAREISDMTAQGYWSEELVEKWLKEIHKERHNG